MRLSLGAILAICLAGLQFLAIIVIVLSSYITSERALLEHARALLSDVGHNAIEHSKGFLKPARGAAELATRLAENRIVASDDSQLVEKLLFQQLQTAPQFAGVFYGDELGNFIYLMRSDGPGPFRSKIVTYRGETRSTQLTWRDNDYRIVEQRYDPDDTYDPRTRPWYQNAQDQRASVWTQPYIFFSSQRPGITVASPVIGTGGRLQGVIGVDIEITAISGFLSQLKIGRQGVALILNRNGDVIAHPNPDIIKAQNEDGSLGFVSIDEIDDPIARAAFGDLGKTADISPDHETNAEFDFDGNAYVSTVMPMISDELPWTIAVYAPEDDFIQGIKQNRSNNIWMAAVVALLTGLVGLFLANRINEPVKAFAVRAALVSQGEIPSSAPFPATYRELEQANEALVREIAQRKTSEREYGRTFDLASRGMAQIDPHSARFLRVNSHLANILGYSADEILKMSVFDILHPDDAKSYASLTDTVLRGSEYIREMRYVRKDGALVWLSVNAILIRDDSGKPLHAVATVDDVTGRKLSETKIQKLNRDLSHYTRVNMMGQMAAGLAHELNQPLTAITQNADSALMTAKQSPQGGSDLVEILTELDQQAHRAGDIIRALRSFVRKDDGAKAAFDLTELLQQSFRLMQAEANEHGVEISFSSGALPSQALPPQALPHVIGARVQIAQVVTNLLSNAIEAIADSNPEEKWVKVTAEHVENVVRVCVTDSGPGVAQTINLFAQFETTKMDGMGLGLSISRSIMEQNGGELWHEAGEHGSRFYFTLEVQHA